MFGINWQNIRTGKQHIPNQDFEYVKLKYFSNWQVCEKQAVIKIKTTISINAYQCPKLEGIFGPYLPVLEFKLSGTKLQCFTRECLHNYILQLLRRCL